MLAMATATGLLVNYALGMITSDISHTAAMAAAIGLTSTAFIVTASGRGGLAALFGLGWLRGLLAVAVLLLYAGPILFEPLQAWDARSIWFFQAKRIFFDGGFAMPGGWGNAAYWFSHIDYPKLLPLLAAQMAQGFGTWNEHLPKAALLALLAPVVLGLLGAARRISAALLLLGGLLLLSGGEMVWNGYMDAFSAMYGGLALLYLARWQATRSPLELVSGVVFLGVALNLKNEGMLFALSAVLVLAITRATKWAQHAARKDAAGSRCAAMAAVPALAAFGVWTLRKWYWKVPNDLNLGLESLGRAWQRIGDGALGPVWHALLIDGRTAAAAALLFAATALARIFGVAVPRVAWYPAAVVVLYLVGISLVYLATPHDLQWHLKFSADRTALTAVAGLFVSCFMVLEAIEESATGTDSLKPAHPER